MEKWLLRKCRFQGIGGGDSVPWITWELKVVVQSLQGIVSGKCRGFDVLYWLCAVICSLEFTLDLLNECHIVSLCLDFVTIRLVKMAMFEHHRLVAWIADCDFDNGRGSSTISSPCNRSSSRTAMVVYKILMVSCFCWSSSCVSLGMR